MENCLRILGLPLKTVHLRRLVSIAQRSGVLFKCLSFSEYLFIKLVIKLKSEVKSFFLIRVLSPLVKRLLGTLQATRELIIQVLGVVDYFMMVAGAHPR